MDNLMGKFTKATKTITETSGQLLKSTKISLSLSCEEEKLNNLYIDIGKKVHEIYLYGGTLGVFFDEKYESLQNIQAKIDSLKKQLNDAKGAKTCPQCGKSVDKNADFCPKCGYSMSSGSIKKSIEIENKNDMIVNENKLAVNKICPHCSMENEQKDKFCLSCGRYIS